jgi:dTDP-4-amino-4,6-dideoxygalactose transaminase
MKDIALGADIVVDLCTASEGDFSPAAKAVRQCTESGGRIWIFAGSLNTYLTGVRNRLQDNAQKESPLLDNDGMEALARKRLANFCQNTNWLAALSCESSIFEFENPEQQQFIQALKTFPEGSIKLISKDPSLLENHPELTLSPEDYLKQADTSDNPSFIDLQTQQDRIRPRLEHNVFQVLRHGQYIMGPEVARFENRLAEYIGARHCLSCSSGTDALLMALMAFGVGPGDAVFTSPFTFISTAEVIALLGATPVFVDIDPATFTMAPAQLEKAIRAVRNNDPVLHPLPSSDHSASGPPELTPRGVIPVDLFGVPADYDRINDIARNHDLFVVEDAAQSLGGSHKGRMAGNLADIGCTSFFPAKPMGCYGDGGALFTQDDALAHALGSIRVHGKGSYKYDNDRIGINGRLDSIQAGMLLAKLDVFQEEIDNRQKVAGRYTNSLQDASRLVPPRIPEGLNSAWAQYSVLAPDNHERQELQTRLKGNGIPSVIYYPKPLHMQNAFRSLGYRQGDFPASEDCASRIFSLPMHPYLRDREQEKICRILKGL